MNASLTLATSAVGHPDGTYSLLRGGINQAQTPKGVPATLKGTLVARIAYVPQDSGARKFAIRCVDVAGSAIMADFSGAIEVPNANGFLNLIVDVHIVFPKTGRYVFLLEIDGKSVSDWPVEVVETKEAK